MNRRVFILNVIYAVTDTIICALAIGAFAFSAYRTDRWWINLFSLIPMALYFQHVVILEVEEEDEQQEGDDQAE